MQLPKKVSIYKLLALLVYILFFPTLYFKANFHVKSLPYPQFVMNTKGSSLLQKMLPLEHLVPKSIHSFL